MRGSLRITKGNGLWICSLVVDEEISAVIARLGTMAISLSGESTLNVECLSPNFTLLISCRFLPTISTREPSGPLVGEMRRISEVVSPDWAKAALSRRAVSNVTSLTDYYSREMRQANRIIVGEVTEFPK